MYPSRSTKRAFQEKPPMTQETWSQPQPAGGEETRWLDGLYLEEPVLNDDDPYRFFRW